MSEAQQGATSPSCTPPCTASRWRKVGEAIALVLKVVAAIASLLVTILSSKGCGPT